MFYDDSFGTGLERNELQGTIYGFNVLPAGTTESSAEASEESPASMRHDNMPVCDEFYAFEVQLRNDT
jgi:hypothetical protein